MTLATQVSGLATRIGTEFKTVRTEIATGLAGKQAADADLLAIAGIDSTQTGVLASEGAGWVQRTYAQVKTSLGLAKADVGLGNVDNTSDANKPVSTATNTALAGKVDNSLATASNQILRSSAASTWVSQAIGASMFVGRGAAGNVTGLDAAAAKVILALVKGDVGLGNVDNTSDAGKPISTATQAALDAKQASLGFTAENAANKGVAGGYASLDGGGKVPAAQLPAYVDDVLEYANLAALPGAGQAGIIYVTIDTNKQYRWSGSAYTEMVAAPGSTDAVPEGAVNLYYTQTRTDARINTLLDAQMGDETTDFVAVFVAALA